MLNISASCGIYGHENHNLTAAAAAKSYIQRIGFGSVYCTQFNSAIINTEGIISLKKEAYLKRKLVFFSLDFMERSRTPSLMKKYQGMMKVRNTSIMPEAVENYNEFEVVTYLKSIVLKGHLSVWWGQTRKYLRISENRFFQLFLMLLP